MSKIEEYKISDLINEGQIGTMGLIHEKESDRQLFAIGQILKSGDKITSLMLIDVLTRETFEYPIGKIDTDFVLLHPPSSPLQGRAPPYPQAPPHPARLET